VKESTQRFAPGELLECGIKPPRLLLTGELGSGKGYIIDTLCELASVMKIGIVATTSYNGIAAVNIDGNTIHCYAIHGQKERDEHNFHLYRCHSSSYPTKTAESFS
jgi:hypothetical protein